MADEMQNGTGTPEDHDHDAMTPEQLDAHNEEFHAPEADQVDAGDMGGADVVPPADDDADMDADAQPKPEGDGMEDEEAA